MWKNGKILDIWTMDTRATTIWSFGKIRQNHAISKIVGNFKSPYLWCPLFKCQVFYHFPTQISITRRSKPVPDSYLLSRQVSYEWHLCLCSFRPCWFHKKKHCGLLTSNFFKCQNDKKASKGTAVGFQVPYAVVQVETKSNSAIIQGSFLFLLEPLRSLRLLEAIQF